MIDTHNNERNDQHLNRSSDFFRNVNIQLLIHELKGPLNVIETNIRMLLEHQKDYGKLNASQENTLKRSMRSAAKLRNIIYSLLEVGRSDSGHIRLQRFNALRCAIDVITDALETVKGTEFKVPDEVADAYGYLEANGIYLSVPPDVGDVWLRQDKTKFMFILGNLIRNSLGYKKSKIMVQLKLGEGNLRISISDDGPGINPDNYANLFECYADTKRQHSRNRGMGHSLGLASSRILARYLGGDIVLNFQFTEGAQFDLHLPLEFDDQSAVKRGLDVCDSEP